MTSVRKEMEQIKKELKNSNLNLNGLEVRLNRAYEENEKLKTIIKSAKEEEKVSGVTLYKIIKCTYCF